MPKGNAATLQIQPQTAKGVYPATWASSPFLLFLTESLQMQVNKYGSQAIRRQSQRNGDLIRPGVKNISGGVELEATNVSLDLILPGAFRTHNFDDDANMLRRYVPYVGDPKYHSIRVNDSETTRLYRDCVISQLDFSSEVEQLVRLSTTWEGIDGDVQTEGPVGGSTATGEYGLYFEEGTVTIGDAGFANLEQPYVKSFSLSLNRNIQADRTGLGSRLKRDLPQGTYDITGSVMLDANGIKGADKAALFRAALDANKISLQLSFVDSVNTLPDGRPSRFQINVPLATIDWPDHNISSEDFIMGNVNFTSYARGALAEVTENGTPTDQFSILHQYTL